MRAPFLSFLLLAISVGAEPFEYMVAVTRQDPSMDWWYAVPEPFVPRISSINSVAKGEYFSIIPIFKNYGVNSNGMANITFDLEVVRPDGSIDESVQGCTAHFDDAIPSNLIPSQAVVHLCFDPEDPYGEYEINVIAYDHVLGATNRQGSVIRQQAFEIEKSMQNERDALFVEYATAPNPSRALSSFLQTEHSFFTEENEPVWSAIWFFKTLFENNGYLLPHLLDAFPQGTFKQQKDTILVLALLNKSSMLPKLSSELKTFKRVMEAGRIPDPYGITTSGKQLDMLWAEYFATGRIKPIRQIIHSLDLVGYVGTLDKIKSGELDPEIPEVYRAGTLEAVFQSALWSLRSNCNQSPLAHHYCIGILESEELEKPIQSCLSMLLKSIADAPSNSRKEMAQ